MVTEKFNLLALPDFLHLISRKKELITCLSLHIVVAFAASSTLRTAHSVDCNLSTLIAYYQGKFPDF
jgi:hypothetical protein